MGEKVTFPDLRAVCVDDEGCDLLPRSPSARKVISARTSRMFGSHNFGIGRCAFQAQVLTPVLQDAKTLLDQLT
jgi:hypothetical protein